MITGIIITNTKTIIEKTEMIKIKVAEEIKDIMINTIIIKISTIKVKKIIKKKKRSIPRLKKKSHKLKNQPFLPTHLQFYND